MGLQCNFGPQRYRMSCTRESPPLLHNYVMATAHALLYIDAASLATSWSCHARHWHLYDGNTLWSCCHKARAWATWVVPTDESYIPNKGQNTYYNVVGCSWLWKVTERCRDVRWDVLHPFRTNLQQQNRGENSLFRVYMGWWHTCTWMCPWHGVQRVVLWWCEYITFQGTIITEV